MPESAYPTIGDIGEALEVWAPPGSAQDYDNVGLQVGDARRAVHRALIALDATPAVLDEARRHDATLIVTHHPLLFHPLRSLTADGFVSSLALRLAEAGIALYSIHTNLDAAPGGVSFALAEHLGLEDTRFLDPFGEKAGDDDALIEQPNTQTGLGALGRLDAPMPLSDFLQRVAERLQAGSLRYVGDLKSTVETVAVCGGSGSSFTGQALRAGADAYVTADVTYHRFFDVLDTDGRPRMALIDAGHYETEALTESLLHDWLRRRFPSVEWRRTETRTSPMETFIPAG